MKIVLTIAEARFDDALDSIASTEAGVDMIEVRLDRLAGNATIDWAAIRNATTRPLIVTRRSTSGRINGLDAEELQGAFAAGIEYADVEFGDSMPSDLLERFRDRVVLSCHDFEAVPDLDRLVAAMQKTGCAMTKIAVTPLSFRDNQKILEILACGREEPWFAAPGSPLVNRLTMIGMGNRGLYSRILAPFFGSELVFVTGNGRAPAAPGQLTLAQALEIYGEGSLPWPSALFAIVGNPVHRSPSPSMHNARFRASEIHAAYGALEVDQLDDIVWEFSAAAKLAPVGLSITVPLKRKAFDFARAVEAVMMPNAAEAGSVNTLLRYPAGTDGRPRIVAGNTDVDGFHLALEPVVSGSRGLTAAVLGAGGTARAALVALRRHGIRATIFNRTAERGQTTAAEMGVSEAPLSSLPSFSGEIVVNTIPSEAGHGRPFGGPFVGLDEVLGNGQLFIDVTYGGVAGERAAEARGRGAVVFDGLQFVEAQAIEQSRLFCEVTRAWSALAMQKGERR